MAGLLIVGVFLLAAAGVWFGAWGQDWAAADGGRWQAPGSEYWFGTNVLGQDIFERALYSVRTAFEIGLVVAMLATALGAVLGAAAGWYSETWVDGGIMWLKGVLDSIPFYLFVAAVAYALQGQPWAMHLAMVATFWTTTGRLVRAEVLKLKTREFVLAARVIGLPGDLIEVSDGKVYVNEHLLDEPFLDQSTSGSYGPVRIGEGEDFVMGDNRDNSTDSRVNQLARGVGFVPAENLIGRANRVMFSSAGSSLFFFWTWRGDRFFEAID